jgi:hypothetical protein
MGRWTRIHQLKCAEGATDINAIRGTALFTLSIPFLARFMAVLSLLIRPLWRLDVCNIPVMKFHMRSPDIPGFIFWLLQTILISPVTTASFPVIYLYTMSA